MVLTEVWIELKTDDGRIYFWNRQDNSRAWTLPEGQEVKWVGEKSQDGRTYYWSRKSKETVWVLPPLPALEPEKKDDNRQEPKEEPPKGALASLLRGEKPEDEKSEDLKKQQLALQEALLNSLPNEQPNQEPQAQAPEKAENAKAPEKENAQVQAPAASPGTAAGNANHMAGSMGMGMPGMPVDPMQAMMMGMGPMGMPGLGGMLPGMMMPGMQMPGMMPGMPGMQGMSMPMPMSMPSVAMTGVAGQQGLAPPQTMPAPAAPAPTVPAAPATTPAPSKALPLPAPSTLEQKQPSEEPYEEHPYLEEEEEPRFCQLPGLPGPKGDSASAIAARHVIEAAGVDTWFLKLPSGEWEEVVRFWPPPEEWDLARPPKLKKKPRLDKWKSRPLAMRCQRHEEVVRALLVAQYSSSRNFSVEKYPCPLSNEWCFWGSDGRQILCEEPSEDGQQKPPNFERNPPEGQRYKLLQNKVRSQLSFVFQSHLLRHLERALLAKHGRAQDLLQKVPTVPEVLKAKLTSVPEAPERRPASIDEAPKKAAPPFKAQAPLPQASPTTDASPKADAAPWKKRKRGERLGAKVPEPDTPRVPEPEAPTTEETKHLKEQLPRKVLLSNVPSTASSKDILDFFTGAIFTATGHTLPQWQGSETSKVVEAVEIHSGGHAEVLFATTLSASIAVALHGINFQNKVLAIKRPPGFSGPPLNRAKLLTVAMQDLVSDVPEAQADTQADTQAPFNPAVVKITGIPSSMTRASVFDCLQQFGGPLKSLSLTATQTGEHNGSGTAEFVDPASALEACRFSPFFGFIEVTQEPRKTRWSDDDLGPFEQLLNAMPKAPLDDDLGPFNDVLPPKPAPDDLDLGPFNDVLQSMEDDLDLGPFNAILPK